MSIFSFIKEYKHIEKPIKNVILSEFFIQAVNATFMNILPLYMTRHGFSDTDIAIFITFRFIGVFLLAIPLGHFIKKQKLMPLFFLSNLLVPNITLCIRFQLPLSST